MEAVTDVVFRQVVASAARPDVFFTEFTNTASYCSPKGVHSTRVRLEFLESEQPIVAQIWGSKPDDFRQMAHGLKEQGFVGIDINMGCPDKSVVKGGAGSGLICNPQLAAEIIAATKEAGLPVSVKTRLGNLQVGEWQAWLGHILRQGISNLTIHLRTRKEMSNVPAHYELIPAIKALRDEIAPKTLLTINGDIRDRAHGEELVKQYGIDGIMIGRGIFKNPYAFASAGKQQAANSHEQLLNLLSLHLDLFDEAATRDALQAEQNPAYHIRPFDPLKRFFKIYINGTPGAAELRDKLMHTKSTQEVREILQGLSN